MLTKAVIVSLRELIAVLEAGNVAVTRYAAAGDAVDVVLSLRVIELGEELVMAINHPLANARQRLLARGWLIVPRLGCFDRLA